jgi:hypothetical protein
MFWASSLAFAILVFGAADEQNPHAQELQYSCGLIRDRASKYFFDHGLAATQNEAYKTEIRVSIGATNGRSVLDISGNRVSISRFGLSKYLAPHTFSPLGIYSDFRLGGTLTLLPTGGWYPGDPYLGTCKATLSVEVSAYHWSPIFIIDGDPFRTHSRKLEQGYLDGIAHQLESSK